MYHELRSRAPQPREPRRKWAHRRSQVPEKKKKKGTKEEHRINWKTRFKMAINTYLSTITLNVNGLNAPIKKGWQTG